MLNYNQKYLTKAILGNTGVIYSPANLKANNNLQHKTLFVVHEDRSHPVLDTFFAHNPDFPSAHLLAGIQDHLFSESELIGLLNDIPRVKMLVQPKTAAAS